MNLWLNLPAQRIIDQLNRRKNKAYKAHEVFAE